MSRCPVCDAVLPKHHPDCAEFAREFERAMTAMGLRFTGYDPNRDPKRARCPGCGAEERPILSPLSARDLRERGLTNLMCPKCARHVWRADTYDLEQAPGVQ